MDNRISFPNHARSVFSFFLKNRGDPHGCGGQRPRALHISHRNLQRERRRYRHRRRVRRVQRALCDWHVRALLQRSFSTHLVAPLPRLRLVHHRAITPR